MLRPRIIPCLLVKNKGLVKTIGFDAPKYVGDPINAVRIFNEKEVDELMVVDIDATAHGREPDYDMIAHLAAECRMPFCYGGGVKTSEQIDRIVALGVEKVAVSSGAIADSQMIVQASQSVGAQSVVVVLDVRRRGNGYEIFTHNGTRASGLDPFEFAQRMERLGAGEIVVNSIDNDGRMQGYDWDLIARMRTTVNLPLTCLGGASSVKDMQKLVELHGAIGAAAGSLFVFKGALRAVLINYPGRATKDAIVRINS
jgi:imidazole glycerol-phosphate synthase subunit HisF